MIATAISTPSTTASPATRPASTRRSEPGPRRPLSLIRLGRPQEGGPSCTRRLISSKLSGRPITTRVSSARSTSSG